MMTLFGVILNRHGGQILNALRLVSKEIGWYLFMLYRIIIGLFRPCKSFSFKRLCDCGQKVPPEVLRLPDPSIYSQFYLRSLDLDVTWDNPDINIFDMSDNPVESSSLLADTDYVVEATISNTSHVSIAGGVLVKCFYRPWSFNSPDTIQIGTTQTIETIQRFGEEPARFDWHTPQQAGHYCIQVECYHPFDINTNNNLGQENTQLIAVAASQTFSDRIGLWNVHDRPRKFRFEATTYAIEDPDEKVSIEWDQKSRSAMRDTFKKRDGVRSRKSIDQWSFSVEATDRELLRMDADSHLDVAVNFTIPADVFETERPTFTIFAIDALSNDVVGGVTYIITRKGT